MLYRLKTHSEKVALERLLGIGEGTLRTWLTRSGLHAEKLHGIFFQELIFAHIQLDELWANVRHASHEVWLWVATEATTKVIPVIQIGPRTLDMAMAVVHALCRTMQPGCTPVFTTDGLKLYYYALTVHFGEWLLPAKARKPVWSILADFAYTPVIKQQRRYRLVKVEHRYIWGLAADTIARLIAAGLSGNINTAFVERINLTIRQCVPKLTCRTWGPAQFSMELNEHLF